MQIQENTSTHWHRRLVINKLYLDCSDKIQLNQGDTRSVKSGRRVNTKTCLSPILFNLDTKYLSQFAPEELGNFNIGRQVIGIVKYGETSCYLLRKKQYYKELLIDQMKCEDPVE